MCVFVEVVHWEYVTDQTISTSDKAFEQHLWVVGIPTNLCLQPFLWPRCTLASNRSFNEKSSDTRKKSGFSRGWFIIFSVRRRNYTDESLKKNNTDQRCVIHPPARLAFVSQLTWNIVNLGLRWFDGRCGGILMSTTGVSHCNSPWVS